MSLTLVNAGVHKRGRHLLQNLSAQLQPNRLTVLLGPNGAGKSTLLRLLSGEIAPDSGRVFLDGRPLADFSPDALARHRAVVSQHSDLAFAYPVEQIVALGRLPWRHASARENHSIVEQAMAAVGLSPLRHRSYLSLSGGEKQRTHIARALAQLWPEPGRAQPRYLLLDEPSSALDLFHQHQLLQLLRQWSGEGCSVLAILHDINLAERYADDIWMLKQGRLVGAGPRQQVMLAPRLSDCYGLPLRALQAEHNQLWTPA